MTKNTKTIVKINESPTNRSEWERLCLGASNLIQSQKYDDIQKFYHQIPVYFEVYEADQLIAGVKCYRYESTKLNAFFGSLSRRLTQMSEFVIEESLIDRFSEIKKILEEAIASYIRSVNITVFETFGIYSDITKQLHFNSSKYKHVSFYTSYVDLTKSDEDLFSSFNRNTKRNIEKAKKEGVEFIAITDIERFLKVEEKVYAQQEGVAAPNFDYIRHNAKHFSPENCQIAVANYQGVDLAGGLLYVFGSVACSVFGGADRNSVGAGHYFYYEWMKILKKQGVKRFYFGQIAKEYDPKNEKFTLGISNFKRGFRCVEIETGKTTYFVSPLKNKIWRLITRLYGKTK